MLDGSPRMNEQVVKLEQQLCFPLYAASRLIVQAYGPHLKKLGITYPQYLVLMVLWEEDGACVKEIGTRLFLDSGTLTPLLKKMQAQGLIRRVRSQLDDRTVLNFLTESGYALKPLAVEMADQLCRELDLEPTALVEARTLVQGLIAKFCQRE